MNTLLACLILLAPLIWSSAFNFPAVLGLGTTLGFIFLLESRWLERLSGSKSKGGGIHWMAAPLAAMFVVLLYLPLADFFILGGKAIFLIGGVLVLLVEVELSERRKKGLTSGQNGREEPSPLFGSILSALGIPVVLGCLVAAGLLFSPEEIPHVLLPLGGFSGAAGMGLIWWAVWRGFSGESGGLLPFPRGMAVLTVLVLAITVVARGVAVWNDGTGSAPAKEWNSLLERAEAIHLDWLEWQVRKKALSSSAALADPAAWVDWAKGGSLDLTKEDKAPNLFCKFSVRGGNAFPDTGESVATAEAVGLAVDPDRMRLWVLNAQGLLVRIASEVNVFNATAEVGPFVHCRLDDEGHPLLLEAGGRLQRLADEGLETICPGSREDREPVFERLCVDPETGSPWALDVYGRIYHSPSPQGWMRDDRFLSVSHTETLGVDVARDITINASGTLALLDCYGRIWSASLNSPEIKGPSLETHFWPTDPLGQSIAACPGGYTVVDRLGGIYVSPNPKRREIQRLRGTYLFPLSLPRKEPDIVDHAFLPERRWVYLLTKSGKILTNHRWAKVWAE
jgi:hypothetical protein